MPLRAFSHVVYLVQRLEIGVVEALFLLFGVTEVEAGAWTDVVDVPVLPMVVPCHRWLKLLFQVESQMRSCATQQNNGFGVFGSVLLFDGDPDSFPLTIDEFDKRKLLIALSVEFDCWILGLVDMLEFFEPVGVVVLPAFCVFLINGFVA